MTITEITKRDEAAIQRVSFIWEKSVRATHLFLTEDDMLDISKDVDDALASVPTLLTAENENSEPVAFMGIDGDRLEMLSAKSFCVTRSTNTPSAGSASTSRTPRHSDSTNTWGLRYISALSATSRGTPSRCSI